MRVEHWNANTAYYRESDCSGLTDSMTRAYGRLIAGAGAFETPAPLRHRDDPWRLQVLTHEHGPRVLQARIVAPDEQPVAVLAVAEGGGDGPRRAWRETVAAVPWMSAGRTRPERFPRPPAGPTVGDHGLATGAGRPRRGLRVAGGTWAVHRMGLPQEPPADGERLTPSTRMRRCVLGTLRAASLDRLGEKRR